MQKSAKPWTFWYWMYGCVSDEGIRQDLQAMKDAGIDIDVVEDGTTFEENALIKARAVAKLCDVPVLADDSGLEVDYLNKEPGIYSARYLGEDTSYTIKNAAIIERLAGVPDEKRTARFVCAVACVMPDGEEIVVRATMEGRIGYEERGENGFGYDSIFRPDGYDVSSGIQENGSSDLTRPVIKMSESP